MNSKLQPALLGGLLLGVLSALPIVNLVNACCCLWVLAGGALAAYLLQRGQAAPILTSDGALVGFFSGVIGAVVWQLLTVPVTILMGPVMNRMIERMMEASDLPENARQVFQTLRENSGFNAARFVLGGIFTLCVSMVFSTIGGLIGAAMVRKKTPPQPDEPPTVLP